MKLRGKVPIRKPVGGSILDLYLSFSNKRMVASRIRRGPLRAGPMGGADRVGD